MKKDRLYSLVAVLLMGGFSYWLVGCSSTNGHVLTSRIDDPVRQINERQVDTTLLADYALSSIKAVQLFYQANDARLAWFDHNGILPLGDSMLLMLKSAENYGLSEQMYRLDELTLLRNDVLAFQFTTPDRLDVLLTDAFLTMAKDLKHGRLQQSSETADVASWSVLLLQDALSSGQLRNSLKSLEPCSNQYLALKDELMRLLVQKSETAPNQHLLAGKISTVKVNMERWRQEAAPFPERYVMINIPAYRLDVIEGGETLLQSKVIVGAGDTPTPLLQSTIWCFTIYPYWNVPKSIAVKEILPKAKDDPTYLDRLLYEVLDTKGDLVDLVTIDWSQYDESNLPYYFRQKEGRENALGIIKFRFDNPFGVYLHDTNAKQLFAMENRALSHGCIRMEKAEEFAYYLVKNDTVYSNPMLLAQYFKLSKRTEISVIQPIPIYVKYFTAWEENGRIIYYPDIYGKDELMFFKALQ